jgi:Glycosyl hydrolase family 45
VSSSTTSACSGGSAYACYAYSPTTVSSCLAYGFAAFNGATCGTCYQLTFTGTASHGGGPGAAAIKGRQMIVQVVNIGGLQSNQFDIMIPGGGVGVNSGTCGNEWNLSTSQLGATYGGFLTTCEGQSGNYATQESCVTSMCSTLPTGLQAGCNWLNSWFQAADNPDLVYQQITCPAALTQISGIQ